MKNKRITLFLAANEADDTAVAANAVFNLAQPDSILIPYGEWRHKVGLQIFDRAAAEAMVSTGNKVLDAVANVFTRRECPVYVGHPDIQNAKDSDGKAYGWADVAGMTAENEGLRIPVRYTEEGRALVEGGAFRYYSPTWWVRKTKRGVVPVALKSVGLTNDPNIPVPALANEAETEDPETEDRRQEEEEAAPKYATLQDELLAMLGLPADGTDDDIVAALGSLKSAAEAANEEAGMAKAKALEAEKTAAEAEEAKTTAANDAAAARASLGLAVDHAVGLAMRAGRLTPAEVPGKAEELLLSNDLAAALHGLSTLPAKVKTESVTGSLGTAKALLTLAANSPEATARANRAQLVANEFESTDPNLSTGERKRIAWRRASAKHPAAFAKSTDGTA